MSSQGLDVTTLAPLPCRACGGAGVIVRCELVMHGWRLTNPEIRVGDCGHCDGTGEEECACCGEAAAVVETDLGPCCARCASAEEV